MFSRDHCLQDVYAAADDMKLDLEQSENAVIEEKFFNAWKSDLYVTNVFSFSAAGTVISSWYNCPGSFHDSTIVTTRGVYDKLEAFYLKYEGECVVHSAFSRSMYPSLLNLAQNDASAESPVDLMMLRQSASVRQALEWGMGGFSGILS